MSASLATPTLVSGTWYISVVCSCRKRIVLFRDLTDGQGSVNGEFRLRCSGCGKSGSFSAEHYLHNYDDKSKVAFAEEA